MNYTQILKSIIEDYQNGVELLFNVYGDKFYGYARDRWQFSEDEAWEIVYQTLDKLIDRLPHCNFSSQGQFDAYVFKVFKSFMAKRYRTEKKKQKSVYFLSIEDSTEGYIKDNMVSDILENDLNGSNLSLIKKALSEMSDLERELLLLKVENYSYKEIARMLKIEENQLKVKHFRAKEKLINKMKNFQKK